MSDFPRAFQIILDHEGGYVDHPDDPGGETNFGISKRSYPQLDIKNLTKKDAADIYRRDFWGACRCDEINWPLNLYLFDSAVNQGVGTAITILQRALGVRLDGVIGPETLAAANAARDSIGSDFMTERALTYTRLSSFGVFGRGWLRRLFKTVEVVV
jgi:lysozyme family protein